MTREPLDVLVIGGGVVGAGAALDAATRGLRVGLVEARDYAAGTSSRSSKLVHGGLRYLEQLDFGLVREALRERSLILNRLCPHLARPVPFLYPLTHRVWERFYVGSGVLLYDTMGGRHGVPSHRHLTRRQALRAVPVAAQGRPGRCHPVLRRPGRRRPPHDDAGAHGGRLRRPRRDQRAGHRLPARGRPGDRRPGAGPGDRRARSRSRPARPSTPPACGPTRSRTWSAAAGQINVRASKGVHIVVPRDRIRADTGIISRTEKSVLFIIPWDAHWIIGTTDTDWELDLAHPAASRSDVDYLLDHANALLQHAADATRTSSGCTPGCGRCCPGESDDTSQLSREHAVVSPVAGPGDGRRRQVHDLPGDGQGRRRRRRAQPPAQGAAVLHRHHPARGRRGLRGRLEQPRAAGRGVRAAPGPDRAPAAPLRLAHRRGPRARRRAPGARRAAAGSAELPAGRGLLRRPWPRARCTSTTSSPAAPGSPSRRSTAGCPRPRTWPSLVAPVLGWSDEQVKNEVEHYRARVAAEIDSQQQPDDRTADAARLGAADVRMGALGLSDAGPAARLTVTHRPAAPRGPSTAAAASGRARRAPRPRAPSTAPPRARRPAPARRGWSARRAAAGRGRRRSRPPARAAGAARPRGCRPVCGARGGAAARARAGQAGRRARAPRRRTSPARSATGRRSSGSWVSSRDRAGRRPRPCRRWRPGDRTARPAASTCRSRWDP